MQVICHGCSRKRQQHQAEKKRDGLKEVHNVRSGSVTNRSIYGVATVENSEANVVEKSTVRFATGREITPSEKMMGLANVI